MRNVGFSRSLIENLVAAEFSIRLQHSGVSMPLWQRPLELPDLRNVGLIAIDVETKDDGLRSDRGSAWPWRGGYICGVSIAWREGDVRAHYLPIRHPDSNNFDPEQVFVWLKSLDASDVRFVTHNGLYDWGWLRTDGTTDASSERLEDTCTMAAIIDENRSHSLESLCEWRGLPGKDEAVLREAAQAVAGDSKRKKISAARIYLELLPARFVGAYAEQERSPRSRSLKTCPRCLSAKSTREAYCLEIDLLPMVHEMRRRGIRIDADAAEKARAMH